MQIIHAFAFQNVKTCLQILLTMPIFNHSGERSFSVLKRMKKQIKIVIETKNINDLEVLSIESNITPNPEFDDNINEFPNRKREKVCE